MTDSEIRLNEEDFRSIIEYPNLGAINQRDNFVLGILSHTDDCGTLVIDADLQKGKCYEY